MAVGDTKYRRTGYRGSTNWDQHDREDSRRYYEMYSHESGNDLFKILSNLPDGELINLHKYTNTIKRYGSYDWSRLNQSLSDSQSKKLKELVKEAKEREVQKYKDKEEKQEAKRKEDHRQQYEQLMQEAEFAAGVIQSEYEAAIYRESYGLRQGQWVDDTVSCYVSGNGFGNEEVAGTGIKMQITVSLDLSNSMTNNGIHVMASQAFRDIYLAVCQFAEENKGSVFKQAFTFSGGSSGEYARIAPGDEYGDNADTEYYLGQMEHYRNFPSWKFTGEDTYLAPLFYRIAEWEKENSDDGAFKLDIIISDAVLEHKKDVKECSEIQSKRSGMIHTIILNLLPENEMPDIQLPMNCIQYRIEQDLDTLKGVLRDVVLEYVLAYV